MLLIKETDVCSLNCKVSVFKRDVRKCEKQRKDSANAKVSKFCHRVQQRPLWIALE